MKKKSKPLKFLKEYWMYIAIAPVIYGFIATWLNTIINGGFMEKTVPFPSLWFSIIGENFGKTGFYFFAIIGAIGGFYLLYKGYKEKKDRWINLILAGITIGWESYVWYLLNGLGNII